jgi:16S rRNA (guanine(966)-N(2))-methyltransferase RsmD
VKPPAPRPGGAGQGRAGQADTVVPRRLPQEVRIIAGQWRRSRLPVADAPGLRPTPDRVRQTLFDWLGQDLTGWRCMDAFAGSGALGFEAASRGAQQVLLVESDRRLASALQQVKARLRADAVEVVCARAQTVLHGLAPRSMDLVFLDPPYGQGLLVPALAAAARVVVPGGWAYIEDERAWSDLPAPWVLHRQGRAGRVHHHLLRRAADGAQAADEVGGAAAPVAR